MKNTKSTKLSQQFYYWLLLADKKLISMVYSIKINNNLHYVCEYIIFLVSLYSIPSNNNTFSLFITQFYYY